MVLSAVRPIRVMLREMQPSARRWTTILSLEASGRRDQRELEAGISLSEGSLIQLRIVPDRVQDFQARFYVGNALVASTLERDRPDFLLELLPDPETGEDYFVCRGHMFRDWAGTTELEVRVQEGDTWLPVVFAGVQISAGKISGIAFDALCREIADYSADVLLDVYGKTFVGLRAERKHGESAPVALMQQLKQVLQQFDTALREIARRPASRLKTQKSRELALPDESVSEQTLEETCIDPTMAFRTNRGVQFREQIRERATEDFQLQENRMLTSFLLFLKRQITDLRQRMYREVDLRKSRRQHRNVRSEAGERTWWEQEDLPRIEELQRMLGDMHPLESELMRLMRMPFLPPALMMREVPQSTQLIRAHPSYAHAFRLIQNHFVSYRVQLDDEHLLTRARSLPVLYEWWCLLAVLRFLQVTLKQVEIQGAGRTTPFRKVRDERERFVVEFDSNQSVDFEDEGGWLVRIRYEPKYVNRRLAQGASYGLLGLSSERTPDIALEIFAPQDRQLPVDIIIIDAKYSSSHHTVKLDEVRKKYAKIGVFRTGTVLSRQVWAMSPSSSSHPPSDGAPSWASACTCDNESVWYRDFDHKSSAAGVVHAVPGLPVGHRPIDELLRLLLSRNGLRLRDV